uniref:NADH-ubiquinone oxidoreductase chain 3 n=1 Tax=Laccotrephes robustus TaxID=575834 RepID=C5HIT2_9HEMI|nr:NADH dehydrogenase subunit 3 [Laccotrephes robustus]ACJ69527.1 NADH dehydrogenase subunit 3 [Laccotrephes robustus]
MSTMLITLMAAIMISMILMVVCYTISKKSMMDREKSSPFECGFDPKSSARMPFSIQFFLIAVLFLIFDIEIVIIMPVAVTMKTSVITNWFFTITMFTMILIGGLMHEWKNGVLEWAN